jgi:hypothetical protein
MQLLYLSIKLKLGYARKFIVRAGSVVFLLTFLFSAFIMKCQWDYTTFVARRQTGGVGLLVCSNIEVVKQSTASYQLIAATCLVDGGHFLVSEKIYLPPQYDQ